MPQALLGTGVTFGHDATSNGRSQAEAFLLAIISSPMAFSKNSIQMWRMAAVDWVPHVYGLRASVGRIQIRPSEDFSLTPNPPLEAFPMTRFAQLVAEQPG